MRQLSHFIFALFVAVLPFCCSLIVPPLRQPTDNRHEFRLVRRNISNVFHGLHRRNSTENVSRGTKRPMVSRSDSRPDIANASQSIKRPKVCRSDAFVYEMPFYAFVPTPHPETNSSIRGLHTQPIMAPKGHYWGGLSK